MPNICIVGFEVRQAELIRTFIDQIMHELEKDKDAITTLVEEETRRCHFSTPAPYLVVRDSNLDEAKMIAETLRTELNVDVEYQKIDGFLLADPNKPMGFRR